MEEGQEEISASGGVCVLWWAGILIGPEIIDE